MFLGPKVAHLAQKGDPGMTHAKYNSLYMITMKSRPTSLERQGDIERPTKRPTSAGEYLVGEIPGKVDLERPLNAFGQQGQLARPLSRTRLFQLLFL